MIYYGMKTKKFKKIVPEDSREFKLGETVTNTFEGLNTPYVKASYVYEPGSFNALA